MWFKPMTKHRVRIYRALWGYNSGQHLSPAMAWPVSLMRTFSPLSLWVTVFSQLASESRQECMLEQLLSPAGEESGQAQSSR